MKARLTLRSQQPIDVAALLSDQRWLAGLARGLVGNEQAIEDVLQETRLRVWRHPPADARTAGGWLRRIASNVALRMRSSEAARRMREEFVASQEHVISTDELAARVEMQRTVAEAVLRLGEPYRATILLRFFDDLPPREIAARLGVPVETVRTRLKRGLAQLRGQLDGHYGGRDMWSAAFAPGLAWSGGMTAMGTTAKSLVAALAVVVLGAVAWRIGALVETPRVHSDDAASPANLVGNAQPAETRAGASADSSSGDANERASIRQAGAGVLGRVRLFGRVFDAETQAPVTGALVKIRYVRSPAVPVEGEARTQEGGAFELVAKDVARKSYSGEVSHPEYASATIDFSSMQTSPVGDGLEANLGTVLLHHGTLVSGRVVMLPDHAPVAGAELFVSDSTLVAPNTLGPDSAWRAGQSRADGSFGLERRLVAPHGPLVIFAVSKGRVGFALLRPYPEQDQLRDFEVPIEPQGALAVRVLDDRGAAVAAAALTAYPTFPPFGQPTYGEEPSREPLISGEIWRAIFVAKTDGEGRARFPSLPEGRADPLFLNQPGHTQSYRIHVVATGWPELDEYVLIARGEESARDIKLRPPCTSLVRGRVLDEGGRPISRALVRVRGFPEALSDADGRYATNARQGPLGGVDIHVSADGFAPDEFGATRDWSRSRMVVRNDDPGAPACEELERDFTLARGTTVRGRVVDVNGAPVANVAVRASGIEPTRTRWVHLDATGRSTGPDGTFVIEGVSVDYLSLEVRPPEGFLQPFPVRVVPGDQNLVVTVLPAPLATARVIANIVDATTGLPLDPVQAHARPLSTDVSSLAGAQCSPGRVVAEKLFVGKWELSVTAYDGRRGRVRFEVTQPDESVQLKVAVGSPGIVDGVLFSSDGKPLLPGKNKWWVWVRPASNDSGDSGHQIDADGRPVSGLTDGCAVFDEEGHFRVGRLPAGVPIRFVVDGSDTSADATVILAPGETRRVEFNLRKIANVQWYQADSLPPGRLLIETAHGNDPLSRLFEAPTGISGTLLATERMSSGPMRWRAEFTSSAEYPPRVRVASGQVDLVPGETKLVDLVGLE